MPKTIDKTGSSTESEVGAKALPRPIMLDVTKSGFIGLCWLVSLTTLVVVMLFRVSAAPEFSAASVDADKVVTQARAYLKSESQYPEQIEIEMMEFIKFVQIELDSLASRADLPIVVSSDVILAGNAVDYSDYVYIHAKAAYEKYISERSNLPQGTIMPNGKLAGVLK